MVILDTDHLSVLEWAESDSAQNLLRRLEPVGEDQVFTCIVCFEEQMRGWMAALGRKQSVTHQIERYRRLLTHLKTYCEIAIMRFDERAAAEFQRLRKKRVRIGTMDLKIAAIALANQAKVLSRNLSDFGKVPDLTVEDWTT